MASTASASSSGVASSCSRTTSDDRSFFVQENMASGYFYTSAGAKYYSSAGSAVVNSVNLVTLNLSSTSNAVLSYMTPALATGYYRISSTATAQGGGWPYIQWTALDTLGLVGASDSGLGIVYGVGGTA